MPERPLRSAAATDTGRQRQDNQDTYIAAPDIGLFAVIDGVGGYAGGDVAAELAKETIRARFSVPPLAPLKALKEALLYANEKIYEKGRQDPNLDQMACVATAALVKDDILYAAHVGDTRLYKLRPPAAIEKLTRDHSLVGLQEDAGELDEVAAMRHPRRNEIMRDLGSESHDPDDPFIELVEASFEPDAAILLCSDGLTDLVRRRDLERLLLTHAGCPEDTVEALIEAANDAGGTDNITVIVVEGRDFPASVAGRRAARAEPEPKAPDVSRATSPSLFSDRPKPEVRSAARDTPPKPFRVTPEPEAPKAPTAPASDTQASSDETTRPPFDDDTSPLFDDDAQPPLGDDTLPPCAHAALPPLETKGLPPEQPAQTRSASRYKILAWIEFLIILALGIGLLWPRLSEGPLKRLSALFESQQPQSRACGLAADALQACLENARPGDTLFVAEGVYVGPLQLRDGVVLQSRPPGAAVLVPGPDSSDAVTILAENITGAVLAGFVLEADTSTGRRHQTAVRIRNAGLSLQHLVIRGTGRPAIYVDAAPGNRIHLDSLTIMDSDSAGIVFQMKSDSVSLTNSILARNGLSTDQPGLIIYGTYLPKLEGNRVYGNGADSILVYPDSTSRLARYVLRNSFNEDETTNEQVPIRIVWPQRLPEP